MRIVKFVQVGIFATVTSTVVQAQVSHADYEKFRAMNSSALTSVSKASDYVQKCFDRTSTSADRQRSLAAALAEYDNATRLFTTVLRSVPPSWERLYVIASDNLKSLPDRRKLADDVCSRR
jgi:hypothetical protein